MQCADHTGRGEPTYGGLALNLMILDDCATHALRQDMTFAAFLITEGVQATNTIIEA